MDVSQLQELCEGITIRALNGGGLAGVVFRNDDADAKAIKDGVIVKAGAPVPQLSGPRGYRVEVSIEVRSSTAVRNAALHGETIKRLADADGWRAGALDAGLTTEDDLYILDEEISGDRNQTKTLRKRTITVPMLINAK